MIIYEPEEGSWYYQIGSCYYGPFITREDAHVNYQLEVNNRWSSQGSGYQKRPDKPSSKLSYFRRMRKTTLQATGITSTSMASVLSELAENLQWAIAKEKVKMEPVFDSKGLLTSVNLVPTKPMLFDNLLNDAIERADTRSNSEGRRIGFVNTR